MENTDLGVFFECFFVNKIMQIENFKNIPSPNSEYEQKVVNFCKKWLSGQKEFTLKTSGSTGEPKPINLTRFQMEASAKLTGKTFNLNPTNKALVCLNIEYIAGIMMLVRGMVLGLELTIIEPNSNPLENLENQKFDFAAFVPLQIQKMLKNENQIEKLNSMKAIIVGGAAVNEFLENEIQQLEVPVYSTYGMTETVSHIAIRRLNGANRNTNFQVLEGVKIGLDERNCLNIIAEASNNELIQTNDIVEIISDNEFQLIGRFDNIINSGGVKIQLEKVEKVFEKIIIGSRFFTFGINDLTFGQKLILVVETQNSLNENVLYEAKKSLSKYEIPKQIFTITKFLETPTGKIDKKATLKTLNLQHG
ncbi:MAG: AMP-binding protein [Arcicella sp.]|nr:AMP-binding protein [Arcicella sp.]